MSPPRASAERVRELYLASETARRTKIAAKDALYRATYEASLDGWSDGRLGKAIGVKRGTVQKWREKGALLSE